MEYRKKFEGCEPVMDDSLRQALKQADIGNQE